MVITGFYLVDGFHLKLLNDRFLLELDQGDSQVELRDSKIVKQHAKHVMWTIRYDMLILIICIVAYLVQLSIAYIMHICSCVHK